ncbi:hypothetical protein [Streptomyces sp. NRRL S-378]|uniref:hypothetical protein n=1 Tax=Streptomyces sp. NRRL S-378 TaxID=1463904 RepID=UPI0004CBCA99|nr:hypothetical protein [Streptomyces sp. NRRL S-378]
MELDGVLRQVPARYHRAGPFVGRLITEPWFRADSRFGGECPVPVRMVLHRPMARTDPRLVVVDDTASSWVLSFTACHDGTPYTITAFYPER